MNTYPDLYDLAYPSADSELVMYNHLSQASEILELGVGTGRLAVRLADIGRSVLGIDISEPMLNRCREKWTRTKVKRGKIQLVCADFCELPINRRFEYIILPFTTFNYLSGKQQYLKCLRNVGNLMTTESIFCLEVLTENTVRGIRQADDNFMMSWQRRSAEEHIDIQYWSRSYFDPSTQIILQERRYIAVDTRINVTIGETNVIWRNRLVRDNELESLIQAAGLQICDRFGTYSLKPLDESSHTAIYVIRRR